MITEDPKPAVPLTHSEIWGYDCCDHGRPTGQYCEQCDERFAEEEAMEDEE